LTIGPIDRCAAILASLFTSFQIKSCTLLCWLADDRNPQLEEIVSNFEITNTRIFSIAGRMFKPDRCHLPDKRFEVWMLINCNKDFKHWLLFSFNQYFEMFVAVE